MQSKFAKTTSCHPRRNCGGYVGGALAASLAAACLQPAPAAAAVTEVSRVRYQEFVEINCTGSATCSLQFIKLAPLHGLEISHVRCHATVTSGAVNYGTAYYLPQNPAFAVPLTSIWQRTNPPLTRQTLDSAVRFQVPRNRHFVVYLNHTGSDAKAYCIAIGERVIYKQQ